MNTPLAQDPSDGGGSPHQNHPNSESIAQHSGCTLSDYSGLKRLPVEFLQSLGMSDVYYSRFPAVRIPYRSEIGADIAIRFRIDLLGRDKFRWKSGTKPCLYGLERLGDARTLGHVALVEGESDTHTLWHAGFPAIGLPGATAWKEDRDAPAFDGISTIFAVIEPDQGGEAVRAWLEASSIRHRVRIVHLRNYKDASAMWIDDPDRFAERWQSALDAAVSWTLAQAKALEATRAGEADACRRLTLVPDILSALQNSARELGLVGESRGAMLLYLAITSRLFPGPISIAVKGPSSGGKSFLVDTVLRFFPSEAAYVLTAMSDRALAYSTEPLSHRMLVLYEAAGLSGEIATYLVRSLLSEGRVRYETVEKTRDGVKARLIEREGPTGLIVTTTANKLHPENETRMLSFTVTDTPEQTRAIMRSRASEPDQDCVVFGEWHSLQRWLAAGRTDVAVPFAVALSEIVPPSAVRLRRDFPAVLTFIRAHALIHQANRMRTADGCILADISDYRAVHNLVADLVAEGVDATVPPAIRETVRAVAECIIEGAESVSTTTVGSRLGLDKAAASRRIRVAIDRGYLRNLEERRGRPSQLVIGEPMPEDIRILPLPEDLERCCAVERGSDGTGTPSPDCALDQALGFNQFGSGPESAGA